MLCLAGMSNGLAAAFYLRLGGSKMGKGISALGAVLTLAGCTHAAISSTPMEIPGVGTVYRYQGRANYAFQIEEGDRLMAEDCKARNGGHPVIVDLQKRDMGSVAIGSGTSTTTANVNAYGNRNNATATGTATTNSVGTVGTSRKVNQEILYKCVTD
jgi:hypothetical protein